MHRSLRSIVTALAIGLVAAIGVPAAAQASTIYPPVDACSTSSATIEAGATIEFSCAAGTFGANEPVTITVTGENGAGVTFAFVRFAISTGSAARTSDATGALRAVGITLPQNASGVYNIAAISPTSAGGAASTSIVGADGLPRTGGDSGQLLGIWIGGGALVAAGAIVLIALALRRRGNRDD
ncbi:MAG: cell wall protein [Microbacterium sp.]|uniref:cell wall protein n=1 Tax=Microbacterium sp. TaxID=51671 RepID=UPI001AC18929|nr:cell wall protein [Microbacterium sp.]MBN9177762.1 cell wall protein [Microbacterium sp.]